MPSRLKIAFFDEAMPTTFSFSCRVSFSCLYCELICSMRLPPTVPMPQMKRLSTLYSDRKNESWSTLSDLRKYLASTTNEMLVSEAPCAQAITLMPLRPSVPNSLPAMPGVCFMFSPTMAMVASPLSACMGNMAPVTISFENSMFSTSTARSASSSRTPIDVEFSDDACDTMNTEMPFSARVEKMRRFTPITPTIERPVTVMSVVPLIEEMPLIMRWSFSTFCLMSVPGCCGLNVFFTLMGMFFTQTG